MAIARKFIDKNVLLNVIRHTDAHNKIQEEKEMWKTYEQKRGSKREADSPVIRKSLDGRMRCDQEGIPQSTQYMQELYNFEANDSERWGHSGFRELYPDEFEDKDTDNSKERSRRKKAKKDKGERQRRKKKDKAKKQKRESLEDVDRNSKKRTKTKLGRVKKKSDSESCEVSETLKHKTKKKLDQKSRKRRKDNPMLKSSKKQKTRH